ncbi:MAG: DVUA0089 family protein [Janthinobacterium lividum]
MTHTQRLFTMFTALALALPFASHAKAATMTYRGMFGGDSDVATFNFSTTDNQQYTFTTTSFAAGGFVPVLTLFSSNGGNPIAFGENDTSDVSLSQTLGPGSYFLALTEDPNVFTTNYAAGTLFNSATATGDLCGVSDGKFLNVFDGCSQRTNAYAVTFTNTTAVTPEPPTWLLVMPAVALLFAVKHYRPTA